MSLLLTYSILDLRDMRMTMEDVCEDASVYDLFL